MKKDLGLLPDMLEALRIAARRPGWVDMRLSPAVRALKSEGYLEGSRHGRVRATDDGREWLARQGG
jgi:hypothetical protein